MDIKTFIRQKAFMLTVGALAVITLLLLTFKAGVSVGYNKAAFACQWSENYHRNFGGPSPSGMMGMMDTDDSNQSHGVFGKIVSSASGTIIVKQNDGVEKSVIVTDDTVIELIRSRVPASEVHVNETAVIIGVPNEQGQIVATFIRLLPPPPDGTSLNSPPRFPGRIR